MPSETETRKVKQLKQRAEDAWQKRSYYDRLLSDVYDYVMPMRDVSGLQVTSSGRARKQEGAARVDRVFDATAVKAAFRFAGRIQADLTPVFQQFAALEAGPFVPDDNDKKQLSEQLQLIGDIVGGVLNAGNFHNSAHEMYVDLYAGTGHMLINEGTNRDIARFRVIPVPEVAIEEGPYGDIWHWYWKHTWRADELPALWPHAEYSPTLNNIIKNNGRTPVEVCQYTYYDPEEDRFKLLVWADKNEDIDSPFWSEDFRTSPWISPRFFKVPGEAYGRGPANLAMPFIKTANKARELALKAAALAIMGVWMRRNDGVFNPETIKFEPLAMWPVASTGGPLGPTLQRLPIPQDFDVSSIVMADEREQMKQALFDDALPPPTGAVRSATEIAEIRTRLSQDLSGVYGRLTLEIVVPVVQRVIDVLERKGLLPTNIKIDQLLTQVRVVAPIAAAQQAAKVQAHVQWAEMVGLLNGTPEAAGRAARLPEMEAQMGRWMGVEERFIKSNDERRQDQQQAQAAAQAAAQAEQQQQQAESEPPQRPYLVSGGV